jgi:hypothetical protein
VQTPPADVRLRRTITRLQSVHPDDLDAILDQLDISQRSRVVRLLADAEGQPAVDEPVENLTAFDKVPRPEDLSLWLVARVNGRSEAGGDETVDQFSMTRHAHIALRQCAAALAPDLTRSRRGVSLMDRIARVFG